MPEHQTMSQTSQSPVSESGRIFYELLVDMCVARIKDSFCEEKGLFTRQLRNGEWDSVIGTEGQTSSAICLIGLHRAGVQPDQIGINVQHCMQALLEETRSNGYLNGLGLVIWANALWRQFDLVQLLAGTELSTSSLNELSRVTTTMELAWLVSGLAHEYARTTEQSTLEQLRTTYQELLSRYEDTAKVFQHCSSDAAFMHRLRAPIANFADQIYSIQALAFTSLTGLGTEGTTVASNCAARMIELQGKLGQWWWHYDARTGDVAQHYPVYSVHQHAMAPMALMALAKAEERGYQDVIELSQTWVKVNEASVSMLDLDAETIWRDVDQQHHKVSRRVKQIRSILSTVPEALPDNFGALDVNLETRPYEWAWCLYAGAIAQGVVADGHVV